MDGIEYYARHDNERHCVALFERASAAIEVNRKGRRFAQNWLVTTLDKYGKALSLP